MLTDPIIITDKSSRYHTKSPSFKVINLPNMAVNPARKTAICNCMNAFFISLYLSFLWYQLLFSNLVYHSNFSFFRNQYFPHFRSSKDILAFTIRPISVFQMKNKLGPAATICFIQFKIKV